MKGRKKTFNIESFEMKWFHGMMTLSPSTQKAIDDVSRIAEKGLAIGSVFGPIMSDPAPRRAIADVHQRIIRDLLGEEKK